MANYKNDDVIIGQEIEWFTLVLDILRNIVFILIGAVAAAMIAYVAVDIRYVPQYTTSATFVVGAKDNNNSYENMSSAYTMASTFEKILESSVMKKKICEAMGVESVDAAISAQALQDTNLLKLSVTCDTPKKAIDTIRVILDNYGELALYTVGDSVMSVLEEPEIPYKVTNPIDPMNVAKQGFIVGAAICVFLFGLISYLRNSIKCESEIEKKLDARSLGAISYEQKYKTVKQLMAREKKAVLVDDPISSFAFVENYKKLASKVEYQMGKIDGKVLVVTSVSENEGKSTVAANLAITLANQGKRVVLIDGDIRRPSQFLILEQGTEEKSEFGEFLKGKIGTQELVMQTSRKNLFFVGGKNCYSSSTEILKTDRLNKLLKGVAKRADYIIIDTPPAGLLGDAQLFALSADAVLMVVRHNYMQAEAINDAMDDFRLNQSKVLGVVLNGEQSLGNIVDTSANGRYGHYGHYGHYNSKSRG